MTGADKADPTPPAPWLRPLAGGGVSIAIAAQPSAKRTEVAGVHGEALKIKVASPPVDGAANEALVAFLAAKLGVKVRDITLIRGQTSRQKVFVVQGVDTRQVYVALLRV